MGIKRLITAVIFLPLFFLYIMKLPPIYFILLAVIVSTVALYEFCSMYRTGIFLKISGIVLGIAMISMSYFNGEIAEVFIVSIIIVAAGRLFSKRRPEASLADIAPVIVGLLYIPGLLGYQIAIRNEGPELVIFLYAAVWGGDALAYYIGKRIGKRKLYEEMSPKKTIAGAVSSVIGGGVSAVIINFAMVLDMSVENALLAGVMIGATTVVGDLVESMFKRDAGVKDSGSFIPGHGGLLDKIDGSLFAGPVFYWLLSCGI